MAARVDRTVDARRRFVSAWNDTMLRIWEERIRLLGVIDTGQLFSSLVSLNMRADGRFTDIQLSQSFLEYGIWQDFGTGRETPIGNPGDIGRAKVRQRRRWFSTKYFASSMRLKEFMAESLGDEFKAMFCDVFDNDEIRRKSAYYRSRGLA